LTGADVQDATVGVNEWDGSPIVMLHFTEDGGRRFAEVTRANVQRKLAIVVDGESLSSPVIQEAITGGSAQITLGRVDNPESLRLEAEALSASLRSGALPAPCTLESVNALH
jgi:preprotein translocase subunit SecD